jgi:hypothetical protein
MKIKFLLAALLIVPLWATSLRAGTPAQEKAFVDQYKAAFEKGDKATFFILSNAGLLATFDLVSSANMVTEPNTRTVKSVFPNCIGTSEAVWAQATEVCPYASRDFDS